jgi:hypothetical protein
VTNWGALRGWEESEFLWRGCHELAVDWGRTAVEFFRFVEKLNLDQLKRLVRPEMIILDTFDCCRRVVCFDDRMAILTLYLESNFVAHDRNPICSNGTLVGGRLLTCPKCGGQRAAVLSVPRS